MGDCVQGSAEERSGPAILMVRYALSSKSRNAILAPLVLLVWALLGLMGVNAEDTARVRSYFRFSSGDVEPLWGVDDHWSLGLGANFNRYVGAELAFDYFLKDWGQLEPVGEASSFHLVPELRLRYPLFKDRVVPYLVGGIGPSWIQGKDPSSSAFDKNLKLEGYTFSVAAGGGIEFFINDNVSFDLQGRYLWVNSINGTVDGQAQSVDLSSALFTFGLRVYFSENTARPLASTDEKAVSRFYFGVRAGADILTDDAWVPGVRLRPEQAAWGGVGSQTGGLLAGLDIARNFGVEIAGDHVNHRIDVEGLGTVAEYGQGWVLANLRVRVPVGHWVPYLYAGGGIAYGEFKDYQSSTQGLNLEGETLHPAVNVGGGVEYFITRNFSINADLRWAYTWNQGFGIENVLPKTSGDYSIFAATIGFRVYLFEL